MSLYLRDKLVEILRALSKGPLTIEEISQKTQIPSPTIYRYLQRAKESQYFYGLIEKNGTLYSLTLRGRRFLDVL